MGCYGSCCCCLVLCSSCFSYSTPVCFACPSSVPSCQMPAGTTRCRKIAWRRTVYPSHCHIITVLKLIPSQVLRVLLDRLKNEVTRLAAVKALATIARSPLNIGKAPAWVVPGATGTACCRAINKAASLLPVPACGGNHSFACMSCRSLPTLLPPTPHRPVLGAGPRAGGAHHLPAQGQPPAAPGGAGRRGLRQGLEGQLLTRVCRVAAAAAPWDVSISVHAWFILWPHPAPPSVLSTAYHFASWAIHCLPSGCPDRPGGHCAQGWLACGPRGAAVRWVGGQLAGRCAARHRER